MKKRFLSLFLIVIFLMGTVSAAVPYKESLTIYNYNINEVQCSNNSLRILVESQASANLNLMFKITSQNTNSIFSNQELKRFETNWFLITTNKACKDLKKLEVNGYLTLDNQNIVYLNSGSSYLFTGTESPITQTATTTEIQPSIQQTTTTTSISNIYFGSKLIETIDSNNEVKYYHQDHLGSNRIITNAAGALVARLDYDPFGKDLSNNNAKYKFTGKEKDSSSLYYFGARYYDPSIGRFTSIDPSFNPSQTPYDYANNNPMAFVDPNGKEASNAIRNYYVSISAAFTLGAGIVRGDSIKDLATNFVVGLGTGALSYKISEFVGNTATPGTDFLWAYLANQVVGSVRSNAMLNKGLFSDMRFQYLVWDIKISEGNIENPKINKGRLTDFFAAGSKTMENLDLGYSLKTGVPTFVNPNIGDPKAYMNVFGGAMGYTDSKQPWLGRPYNDFVRRHEYLHFLQIQDVTGVGRALGLGYVPTMVLFVGLPWLGLAAYKGTLNPSKLHHWEWYEQVSDKLATKKLAANRDTGFTQ